MKAEQHKHILLVGGHDDIFAHLGGLPYRFSVMHVEDSIGPNARALASRLDIISELASAPVIAQAMAVHAVDPVDVIFSFTEDGLLPAAEAAQLLGVRGIDLEACRMCIDKAYMRDRLEGTCFGIEHRRCDSLADAEDFLRSHPSGMIVKASRGAGSDRVYIIRDHAQLADTFAAFSARGDVFLVEEYLTGRMLSLETLTIRGVHEVASVTGVTLRSGTLIPEHHIMPAPQLTADDYVRIESFCIDLLNHVGYTHGPCHIEVKMDDTSIRLIEINNRVGGDGLGMLIHETTGIDCFRETIAHLYEGRTTSEERAERCRFAIGASRSFFVPVDRQAVVSAVDGLTLLRVELPDVPTNPAPVKSADDRIGPLIYVSNDRDAFMDAYEKLNHIAA